MTEREDLEAYRVKGNCLNPDIEDGDDIIVNKRLSPGIGDIVIAYHPDGKSHLARYCIDQVPGKPYLLNGDGKWPISPGDIFKVVIAVSRKLKGPRPKGSHVAFLEEKDEEAVNSGPSC